MCVCVCVCMCVVCDGHLGHFKVTVPHTLLFIYIHAVPLCVLDHTELQVHCPK